MNRSMERNVIAGLVIVFLVLIINAFLSNRAADVVLRSQQSITRTYAVKAQLEKLLSLVVDIETGGRGYVITSQDIYLEPYQRALPQIDQEVIALEALTRENPTQQALLQKLKPAIKEKLEIVKGAIDEHRANPALPYVPRGNRGKQVMDEIRVLLASMANEENGLLEGRRVEAQASANDARLTFGIATFIALALVAMMGWVLVRGLAERRRHEAALENEQEWLETTLSSIGDAVIATDETGRVRFLNRLAEDLTGWRAAEVIGRPAAEVFNLINEQTRQPLKTLIDTIIHEGKSIELKNQLLLLGRGGGEIAVDNSGAPIRDTKGRIIGAVLAFRDTTARRQSETEKERLASLHNLMLESTGEGIYGINLVGECTFINQAAARMFGYTPEEMLGRNLHTLVHYRRADGSFFPDDECPIYLACRAGQSERLEDDLMWRRDGTSFYANCSSAPLIEYGVVKGAVVTLSDQTERRRSDEALRVSRERLSLVLDSVKLGMWYSDAPFQVFDWSDICKEHYWMPPEVDVTFDLLLSHVHPDDRRRTQRAMDKAIEEHQLYDVTHRTLSPEGRQKWIRAIGRASYSSSGKPLRFDGVTLDVTAQKRTEESLRQAGRLKDEFLATVSHELRTPLNAIIGWTNLLRGDELDQAGAARALETIERNATAQARLIEDLLDVSRIISGKLRLEKQMVELGPVIQAAIEVVNPAAESKQIELAARVDEEVGPVSGDPQRLQQVIWNLLSNAVKFTPRGGHIEIDVSRQLSQVQVKVTDTGRGIEQEFLPYVFDRFRQAEGHDGRKFGGLGLGLSIVKHLVEAHGGTIRAESEGLDRGATFIACFPVPALQPETARTFEAITEGHDEEEAALLDQTPSLDGLKILIVDDEADARDLLSVVLQKRGASVVAADSVAAGLERLGEQEFDVLISDIQMPNTDGYEFIRRVREREAGHSGYLPAIALTAHARPKDRMQVLAAGFQMHVSKPVSTAELVMVVASLAGVPGGGSMR